jgi:hypothetical protein
VGALTVKRLRPSAPARPAALTQPA